MIGAFTGIIMKKTHQSIIHLNTFNRFMILVAAMLALLFFSTLVPRTSARSATPGDGRNKLINIYDKGTKTTVITNGSTVKEAMKDSGIVLNEHDRVEPSLETEIKNLEFNINVYRARPVVIVDGGAKLPAISSYQTGNEIVKGAQIAINEKDIVRVEKANELIDGIGLRVVITRATPINLTFYGNSKQVYTQAKDVAGFIKEEGLVLGPDDRMSHLETDAIVPGMPLRIWREGRQTITVDEEVPFTIEKIQDADKEPGFKEIRQPGKKGQRTVTYEIIIQDGVEVSRKETGSITTQPAIKQVEVHGAKFTYTGGPLTDAQITALGMCESGMTATRNSGNGFYGAFQFMPATWRSVAPAPYNGVMPHQAPLEAQKQAVQNLLSRSSIFTQFPGCAKQMRSKGIL